HGRRRVARGAAARSGRTGQSRHRGAPGVRRHVGRRAARGARRHPRCRSVPPTSRRGQTMTDTASAVYYDPYDFEIDADPYPIWKRLRDEAPLYYNEKYDFFAVSRFDDVERCSVDWKTYRSGRGSVLELIKSGVAPPPGNILFE